MGKHQLLRRRIPVPLGFVSYDPRVVARAQSYLAGRIGPMIQQKPYEEIVMAALLEKAEPRVATDQGSLIGDVPASRSDLGA